jgi:flagellar basal-body rod modification protein FlgD
MSVTGVTSTGSSASSATSAASSSSGFNGLDSTAFLKLLITQLQNQDPTQPTSNEELLQQLSAMRSLQSNIELSDTLKSFASNQDLTAGASFLGKSITGTDANNNQVAGVADRVFVQDGKTILGIGNSEVPLANVSAVNLVPST